MSQSFGRGDASARAEHQTPLQVRHGQQRYCSASSDKDSGLKRLHGSAAYRQQVVLIRVQVREQLGAESSWSPALRVRDGAVLRPVLFAGQTDHPENKTGSRKTRSEN